MKISSVKSLGIQKVYSLEMDNPHHNYVLPNGLVSQNSHSVSYGTVSYQTAFLKANFPAEFWAAQLSYESDQVKINKMIIEAKSDGTKVLPVSVNTSSLGYESETPVNVRRSLGTLKSVGKVAIAELVRCRPYASVPDFIMKTDGRKINKKTVQALISAGAFDEFGIPRRTLSTKIDDCKASLDKFVKKKFEAYAKAAGVRKGCLTTPVELDLELIAKADLSKIENNEKLLRAKEIAIATYEEWLKVRPTIESGEYETVEEAITVNFKKTMKQWVQAFAKIVMENEWTYNFIEQDVDKVEWTLSELITAEKLVYGTAVSAHIFDQHLEVEKRVMEKYPTNFYTFDSGIDQLSNGFEIVAMVEVVGLDRQFPYKKDPTKFTRLFKVEDRFGAGELTVFDKSYDDFVQDERGTPVRVWRVGNILVVKAKMNIYGARKSLVYDKCLKLVASK